MLVGFVLLRGSYACFIAEHTTKLHETNLKSYKQITIYSISYLQGRQQFFVNAAKAAVRHDRDDVALAKLRQQMRDDFIRAGKREGRLVLFRNSLDQLAGVERFSFL